MPDQPPVIVHQETQKEYPSELLTECPDELPGMELTEAQWDSLSDEVQEAIRAEVLGQWSATYFKCAGRHNKLIKAIEE